MRMRQTLCPGPQLCRRLRESNAWAIGATPPLPGDVASYGIASYDGAARSQPLCYITTAGPAVTWSVEGCKAAILLIFNRNHRKYLTGSTTARSNLKDITPVFRTVFHEIGWSAWGDRHISAAPCFRRVQKRYRRRHVFVIIRSCVRWSPNILFECYFMACRGFIRGVSYVHLSGTEYRLLSPCVEFASSPRVTWVSSRRPGYFPLPKDMRLGWLGFLNRP